MVVSVGETTSLQLLQMSTSAELCLCHFLMSSRLSFLQGQKFGEGMFLLPSLFLANPNQVKVDALGFVTQFQDDLPAGSSLLNFRAELDTYQSVLATYTPDQLPPSLADCAKLPDESLCKGISQILIFLATLLATTCPCERSVSRLRRLKT